MFGRKKKDAKRPMSGDGPGGVSPTPHHPDAISTGAEFDEAVALAQTGLRGTATITSVDFCGPVAISDGMGSAQSMEWRIGLRVQPWTGDAFAATIDMLYDELITPEFPPWAVGNTVAVVFDQAEPRRVRFKPPGDDAAAPRWRIPALCPSCAAPVDQAAQSMADQPMCQFCQRPLPSEPWASS